MIDCTKALQRPEEIEALYAAVSKIKPKTIVEIGTANGGTTILWAEIVRKNNGRVIGIDLFKSKGWPKEWTWVDVETGEIRKFPIWYRGTPLEDYITEIKGDSNSKEVFDEVVSALNGKPIDFLFIDGGHRYTTVKKDWDLYHGLVREGGLIALHDIAERGDYGKQWGVEVYKLWDEIQHMSAYQTEEFISPPVKLTKPSGETQDSSMGIGLIRV